ncbi:putative ABC transporter permease YknZ [Anatilimnocola aggregata]|uniref:Putative ABC transporter permease YknZ n=1 Tax=Anatilimnocola aggregata TaxID=2528021 RepID=A0A517Y9V2_9BACT|nr:ABC transporter permease [Anatilimnocola aggregata]QDU26942.1 putative ABC transporter permease YknZ [Anatilimnocola aggregata]
MFSAFNISPLSLIPLVTAVGLMIMLTLWGRVPLRYNLRNLSVRWLTTVLTAIGFVLVIGLLTVMLAFVNGMVELTKSSGQPGNVLVISEGFQDETFSNLTVDVVTDVVLQPGILRDEKTNEPLASPETYLVVVQPIENQDSGRAAGRRFLQVRGVDDAPMAARVHGMSLLAGGRWLSREGVTSGGEGQPDVLEAVIGIGMARELGSTRTSAELAKATNRAHLDIGDFFTLGERKWMVVGVMAPTGSTFDSEIWAKRGIVAPMFGKNSYSSVVLRAAGAPEAQKLKAYLNNDYAKSVQAYVETEYFASLQETSKQFLFAIIVFAAVMSIGGLFGVMNTMFATVAQRSRDIGVLRMLGYSRAEVLSSFLVESLCLAMLGGALGCALGTLADGYEVKSIIGGGQGGGKFVALDMAVSGDIIAAGMTVALVIGALGGLLPAISAMLVKPLYSLR